MLIKIVNANGKAIAVDKNSFNSIVFNVPLSGEDVFVNIRTISGDCFSVFGGEQEKLKTHEWNCKKFIDEVIEATEGWEIDVRDFWEVCVK